MLKSMDTLTDKKNFVSLKKRPVGISPQNELSIKIDFLRDGPGMDG